MYKAQDHLARKLLVKHQYVNGQSEHVNRPISSMCMMESSILRTQVSKQRIWMKAQMILWDPFHQQEWIQIINAKHCWWECKLVQQLDNWQYLYQSVTYCYGLNCIRPKFVCGSPNPQYLKVWLSSETGTLKMWLRLNEVMRVSSNQYDWCPYEKRLGHRHVRTQDSHLQAKRSLQTNKSTPPTQHSILSF